MCRMDFFLDPDPDGRLSPLPIPRPPPHVKDGEDDHIVVNDHEIRAERKRVGETAADVLREQRELSRSSGDSIEKPVDLIEEANPKSALPSLVPERRSTNLTLRFGSGPKRQRSDVDSRNSLRSSSRTWAHSGPGSLTFDATDAHVDVAPSDSGAAPGMLQRPYWGTAPGKDRQAELDDHRRGDADEIGVGLDGANRAGAGCLLARRQILAKITSKWTL